MASVSPSASPAGTASTPVATGALGFVLIVIGASGLLHEWLGLPHFLGFVRFAIPSGYEVQAYLLAVVLGVIIGLVGSVASRRK